MFGWNVDQARLPWRTAAQAHPDVRQHALAHAVLAPSPHNMQAWRIELVGEDRLRLHPDLARLTPAIDPFARQTVIGYGAFLELLRQAASTRGYDLQVSPFPDGADERALDERPIADVAFTHAGTAAAPLASLITARRTNRDGYDRDRPVDDGAMQRIAAAIRTSAPALSWTNNPARVEEIAALAKRAWEVENAHEPAHLESVRLTRIGAEEVNANPDGLSVLGLSIEALHAAGLFTRDKMAADESFARAQVVKTYNAAIDRTATFAWLVTSDDSRLSQLDAGAAWVRINQAAAREGVSMQPISQLLEEFPAMAALARAFVERVGVAAPARVQGLFRMGYGKDGDPAPRWPLEAKLTAPHPPA